MARSASPALDAAVGDRPRVALLDALPVLAEAQQRRAGERDVAAVLAHERPPLDRGAVAVDERLAEPRLGPLLLGERPLHVLPRRLRLAKRLREEEAVVRVDRDDRLGVERPPAAQPAVDPAPCRRRSVVTAR